MNTVVPLRPTAPAAAHWTPKQLATIKQTVARDTNAAEFDLFIEYARAKGLDPFSKQVIAVVFSKDNAERRQMTIITTQDGLRVLASRCGDYRPEETEPEYEYDPSLKGDTNPLGVVKCTVKLWKQDPKNDKWHPVIGVAYWDEFAPIKKAGEGFEWVGTGKFYPEGHAKAGKEVFKKKIVGEIKEVLDDSGLWKKMPRNQIAKCARMQALRGGWPETFAGVYGQEEMDRAITLDLSATEIVEHEEAERRAKAIAMTSDEYPTVDDEGNLHFIPAGKLADHFLALVKTYDNAEYVDAMLVRNRQAFQRFWARHKDDALELRRRIDARRTELAAQPAKESVS
jgi:phage recombination protein Bet